MSLLRTTAGAVSLALLLGLFTLAGCAKRQTVVTPPDITKETPAEPEPYVGPVTLDVLKERRAFEGISTIRSEVKATVYKFGEKEGRFKGIFVYQSPNNVRLKLVSPIGLTAMEILMADGLMQVYVPHQDTIYEGKAPGLSMPANAMYGLEVEQDGYVLYAFRKSGDIMQILGKYSYQADTLRNTGVTVYSEGRRFLGVMLGLYAGNVPTGIRLSFFNGYAMELILVEPEVDISLPFDIFTPMEPAGQTMVVPMKRMMEQSGF